MLRWLSALSARLLGKAETPPPIEIELSPELAQAQEEYARYRRAVADAAIIQEERLRACRACSEWARDVLHRREPLSFPSRLPPIYTEWLVGLTVAQLEILGRQHEVRLYNHISFPYHAECLIPGLPKRQPLPRQILVFPSPFAIPDFDRERRSGGGPKRGALNDLRHLASQAPRVMR